MRRAMPLSILTVLTLTGVATAMPGIDVGNRLLLPNTPHQAVFIDVTGGDPVQGLNFTAQIGNLLGSHPVIESVDLITGTIFGGNNTGQQNPGTLPPAVFASTTTGSGTIGAAGRLATLWVDTTGFFSGSGPWSLNLAGTAGDDTDFAGIPANITNGVINIGVVPEPATLACLSIGALGLLHRRRR